MHIRLLLLHIRLLRVYVVNICVWREPKGAGLGACMHVHLLRIRLLHVYVVYASMRVCEPKAAGCVRAPA